MTADHLPPTHPLPTPAQQRRLRDVWRSAGWPYQDLLEAELLAAGLLERRQDSVGRDVVRVTDAGVRAIAAATARHRTARSRHEELVERVAVDMLRAGRLVWRGIALRAALAGDDGARRWVNAMPDVFSIRHATTEDQVEPVVHEIKVSRADLLADLRNVDKGAAYAAVSSHCWYVLAEGIGDADEVPETFGVMGFDGRRLDVLRPAPRRPARLALSTWIALARHDAEVAPTDAQQLLGADHSASATHGDGAS